MNLCVIFLTNYLFKKVVCEVSSSWLRNNHNIKQKSLSIIYHRQKGRILCIQLQKIENKEKIARIKQANIENAIKKHYILDRRCKTKMMKIGKNYRMFFCEYNFGSV